MITEHWPLYDLRITTPRLELRLPTPDDLAALATLAAGPIHDPARMPFASEWTDAPPAERSRSVLQHHWRSLAEWTPRKWTLQLVTVADDTVIGTQAIGGDNFAVVREVHTGSWLGQHHQGRGFGVEMRAAVLHLAFHGLGAREAVTGAVTDNPASLGVSRRLGYVPNGVVNRSMRGKPAVEQRFRLERANWRSPIEPITLTGVEPCLALFGIQASNVATDDHPAPGV
ncbi:GNAT family N-acetyltransferase [Cryptosporangium arvum]|uniref:Acetyltransferase, ribosomal protein N-acetylase n=1 Tax=Cryptosporangium arvum DSM 44712 TaxID=927661 RepID=A0A010YJF4_9ACTN|nr:GNAT family protein [Cryptosporangium arvum]EXG80360.1 acetyltransferase, ribosomal protein N-acetylase [Cryptosporangium arvum DSM 44712]